MFCRGLQETQFLALRRSGRRRGPAFFVGTRLKVEMNLFTELVWRAGRKLGKVDVIDAAYLTLHTCASLLVELVG